MLKNKRKKKRLEEKKKELKEKLKIRKNKKKSLKNSMQKGRTTKTTEKMKKIIIIFKHKRM